MALTLDEFVRLLPALHSAVGEYQQLLDLTSQSRFPEGEFISSIFRTHYRKLSPEFGIDPDEILPTPVIWADLTPNHKRLMVATSAVTLNEIMLNSNVNQPAPLP